MLTEQIVQLISTYTIGCVATVRPDGAPAVSPKGTFIVIVIDDRTIAFADIMGWPAPFPPASDMMLVRRGRSE